MLQQKSLAAVLLGLLLWCKFGTACVLLVSEDYKGLLTIGIGLGGGVGLGARGWE